MRQTGSHLIEDNGIGIPKYAHEKIFGMFQRMHRPDEYPGTGIGLALVKKSLERTGGSINLESEPGKAAASASNCPSRITSQLRFLFLPDRIAVSRRSSSNE